MGSQDVRCGGTAVPPRELDAHHVFTYANSVHQALKRIDVAAPEPVEAIRALLHGAMARISPDT